MGDIKGFLKVKRQISGYRPACERVKDYEEVFVLRSDEHSVDQASRCMDCGTPFCHWGCPIGNYIPEWNDFLFGGHWEKALRLLEATNNMPEITGRLCPAPCEFACVLGINDEPVTIKENELSIIEYGFKNGLIKAQPPLKRTGKIIAIIGSGPAGLTCASQLNRAGHKVVVFEKDDKIGGILRYGIPDFKLDKGIIERRLKIWKKEGIEFRTNLNVLNILNADFRKSNADGRRFYLRLSACNLRESALRDILLKDKFDAVCLAGGCRQPRDLKIEGRQLGGIYFAMDYLIQANKRINGVKFSPDKLIDAKDKRVVIIGGGDTGADCVGTAHRQGATCIIQIEILPKPPEIRSKNQLWPKNPVLFKTSSSHEEGNTEQQWQISTKKFIGENRQVKKLSCVRVDGSTSLTINPERSRRINGSTSLTINPERSRRINGSTSLTINPERSRRINGSTSLTINPERSRRIDFSQKDENNRAIMQEVGGSEFEIEADLVILALGFVHPQHSGLIKELDLELDTKRNVKTDQNYMTSVKDIFCCGDMHRGQSLIVWAISEGRRAAYCMDKYLMGQTNLPMT